MQIKAINAAVRLTMINGKECPGVVFLFSDFARNILAQQVQSLISAVAGHLLTRNHLQQRQKNSFKVFRCICNGRVSMNEYQKELSCNFFFSSVNKKCRSCPEKVINKCQMH